MAQQAHTVSYAPLKRLELKTGSTYKVFIPNHNARQMSFSLQRHQSGSSTHDVLMLVIHNDRKPLISIRLTDVLRNPSIASHVISTDASTSVICVKIPSPDCTLLAHFEDARDFHVCLSVLERVGFPISSSLRSSSISLVDPAIRTSSDSIAPMRLSSATTFPSSSQPELSLYGHLPRVASSALLDPFSSHSLQRTVSVPSQNFSNSLTTTTAPQLPVDLNPYNHFAPDRPSAAAPLRDLYPRDVSSGASHVTNTRTEKLSWNITPSMAPTKSHPPSHPPSHQFLTAHSDNTNLRSSLAIEQLDADALSKASDFRQFMPQARSLPFTQTKRKVGESNTATTFSATKRKRGELNTATTFGATKRKAIGNADSKTELEKDISASVPDKRQKATKRSAGAQTDAKRPQNSARIESESTVERNIVNRRRTTVAKNPAHKKSPLKKPPKKKSPPKKARKSTSSKGLASTSTSSPNATPTAKQKREKLTMQAASARKGTSKKIQPQKKARKVTSSTPVATKLAASVMSGAASFSSANCTEAPQPHQQPQNISKKIMEGDGAESSLSSNLPRLEAGSDSTLLVTETTVLDALNKMTSRIIDQYEADLDYGLNRFEIAQYYVDNLYNTRFEFWHDKLAKLGGVHPLHVRRPIS